VAPGAARLIHLGNLRGVGMSGGLTVLYLGTILLMRRSGGGTGYLGYLGFLALPLALGVKAWRRRLGLS